MTSASAGGSTGFADHRAGQAAAATSFVGKLTPTGRRLLTAGALLALMALHFSLIADQIARQTPTVDEVAHLPAGRSYIEKRTFRLYPHNPPLARLVPALAAGSLLDLDYEGTWRRHQPPNHWQFAFECLERHADSKEKRSAYLAAFSRARLVVALVSVTCIPMLFAWGAWWLRPASGWVAALLWTICPNALAHAGLVTTDLFATASTLWASFAFARWLERPRWTLAIAAGVALGVALLVKFSSLVLLGILPAWWLFDRWMKPAGSIAWINELCVAAPLMLAAAVLTLDAGYLFEGVGTPMGKFAFLSRSLTRPRTPADGPIDSTSNVTYNQVLSRRVNRFRGTILERVPSPLPAPCWTGFDEQKFEAEGKYPMYFRGQFADRAAMEGETGRRGWKVYYLYALLIKLPIGTLVLIAMGAVLAIFHPGLWGRTVPWLMLAATPIVTMSLFTDINLGLRYVLPSLPFLFLIASVTVAHPGRWRWGLAILAIVGNLASVARVHPHELSYFNELVGGPIGGRWHLIDSNIDWGQDLRQLARWIERHPEWREVRLAYMGTVPPSFEGIESERRPPRDLRVVPLERRLVTEKDDDPWSDGPVPGKFAVSVNFERGLRFHSPLTPTQAAEVRRQTPRALVGRSSMLEVPSGSYGYFQYFTPIVDPEIGYSILLYDVSLEDANRVRASLNLPLLPTAKANSR